MKRYFKVTVAVLAIFSLSIFLAFQQTQTKITALAATPMGFNIFKPDPYVIKTVQNPIGSVDAAKAQTNTPGPIMANLPSIPPLPIPPSGFPLPSSFGQDNDSSSIKVVGIIYSNSHQKATLKINDDYITVTPGFTGKGFTVLKIENDGVIVRVGNAVQHLKYGNE